MADKKEAFYVGIQDPVEFRKNLLSSCKNIIVILKEFEIQKEKRKTKIELESLLNKKLKEISFLVNKLNSLLPRMGLRSMDQSGEDNLGKSFAPKKEKPKANKDSPIDKLEKELANIERKMRSVSS